MTNCAPPCRKRQLAKFVESRVRVGTGASPVQAEHSSASQSAEDSIPRIRGIGLSDPRLRIRVSLYRYRKFFEIACPFRG